MVNGLHKGIFWPWQIGITVTANLGEFPKMAGNNALK
jgi:hypothetical protein